MKQPVQNPSDLPFAVQLTLEADQEPAQAAATLHAGGLCPACKSGRLEYDGLLNLGCPACGYTLSGCFT